MRDRVERAARTARALAPDSARTGAAAARAAPRTSCGSACQSGRSSSAGRSRSADPVAERLDRVALGRQQQLAGAPRCCRSSQARNPGTGDKVANTLSRGRSAASASTTRLIRKSPKLIPLSPLLAIRDRIEDRGVGGLRIADRRGFVEQRADVARHARDQRHLDKDQRLVGHARVKKGEAAAVGLEPVLQDRSSCGFRAPPRRPSAFRAVPPAIPSRSASARESRYRTSWPSSAPQIVCEAAQQRVVPPADRAARRGGRRET